MAINNSLGKKQFNSHLLHGVTGSGKTEIFIEVIKTVIKKNEPAIVLLPEFSLTPTFPDVHKALAKLLKDIVESTKQFNRWNDGTCLLTPPQYPNGEDEEPYIFSYYQDISSDQDVVKIINK